MTIPYNPLDIENLGRSVEAALLSTEAVPLADVATFAGAGLYAIYYVGAFPAYEPLTRSNWAGEFTQPIYVGKAVPAGGRRGLAVSTSTRALYSRLAEHRASIEAVNNLDVGDFFARWLVVEPIWIPLGESMLITRFVPVWNAMLDGFGNHDPGAGRHNGLNTKWDTLHPGRDWAGRLVPRAEPVDHIGQDVLEYLRDRIPLDQSSEPEAPPQ